MPVSPLASVDPRARLADDVVVGPFCVVGPHVTLGPGNVLVSHVSLLGSVLASVGNTFSSGVVIGGIADDASETTPGEVLIGDNCRFHENTVVQRGTHGDGLTVIGDGCRIHPHSRISADCRLGVGVRLGSHVQLGRDAHVEDHASIDAGTVVGDLVTVGSCAQVASQLNIQQDAPPYVRVDGDPPRPQAVDVRTLKEQGVSPPAIESLLDAFQLVCKGRAGLDDARRTLRKRGKLTPHANYFLGSLQSQLEGRRGRAREPLRRHAA